ncbi:hypothetical protein MMC14_007268 [Varicellaria rhodocarpa]|nr:hypothetical protein [Varicellaria rhodocarpa]
MVYGLFKGRVIRICELGLKPIVKYLGGDINKERYMKILDEMTEYARGLRTPPVINFSEARKLHERTQEVADEDKRIADIRKTDEAEATLLADTNEN